MNIHFESGSPSCRLDKINMEAGVVKEGERDEKEVTDEHGDNVQLGWIKEIKCKIF